MIYEINLSHSPYALFPEKTVIIPTEQFAIKLVSDTYTNLALRVTLRLNGMTTTRNLQEGEVLDFTEQLKAGTLEIVVDNIINGKIAKRWEISPIIIIEEQAQFQLLDLYTALEERIAKLEAQHEIII